MLPGLEKPQKEGWIQPRLPLVSFCAVPIPLSRQQGKLRLGRWLLSHYLG